MPACMRGQHFVAGSLYTGSGDWKSHLRPRTRASSPCQGPAHAYLRRVDVRQQTWIPVGPASLGDRPDVVRGSMIAGRASLGRGGLCTWGQHGVASIQVPCVSVAFAQVALPRDCAFPGGTAAVAAWRPVTHPEERASMATSQIRKFLHPGTTAAPDIAT